ncbi:AAA family ATPase [Streptacidiphilus sp. ASG 303]|uniref:helix-turn-helix transcriptional regulator n=1 Tax=Streptacidiphilus sp. ASG 303 TaxID=2896847 RepID=UPI001E2D1741|nr:AAA family ATPase [Streptacidiphilus sp. ASG 303]MCD0483832.1 AAA family ATPase [Streptacidiphilus sp. ASG 303]
MTDRDDNRGPGPEGGAPAVLLEREQEVAAAERAVDDLCRRAAAGGGRPGGTLLVSGSAGTGKTALLTEVRRIASARGDCRVLFARGGEQQRSLPFHVVRQLLQPVLVGRSEAQQRELFGLWYGITGPAAGLFAPPDGALADPQGVRDGLDQVFTRLARPGSPLVLVVDDLHWADPESAGWLASFRQRVRELPVLLVLAHRPDDLPREDPFPRLVEDGAGRPLVLRPLGPAAVAELVRATLGRDADDAFCRECWTVTAGNPYEAVELLARAEERGIAPTADSAELLRDLGAAVRGAGLVAELEKLGPETLRYAWAAAVLGDGTPAPLAARLAAMDPAEAGQAAERLREARVIKGGPVLEFVHPLIATAVYRAVPPAARTAMHGVAAQAVRDAGLGVAVAARHLLEVHPDGDDDLVEVLREAAREHVAVGAPDAARRCLERALAEPPADGDRADVQYELGCATLLTQPAVTVNHLTAALARPGLTSSRRENAALRLAQALGHLDRLDEAVGVLAAEAARTPPGPARTRLLAGRFIWSALQTDDRGRADRSRQLADLAGELDGRDDAAARVVHVLRAWDLTLRGEPAAEAQALVDRALDAGRLPAELGWTNRTWGFEVPTMLGMTCTYTDRLDLAEELFGDAVREFEVAGWSGSHLGFAYFLLGLVRFRGGRLSEAEDFLRSSLRTAERLGRGVPLQWDAVGVLIETLLARGRADEAMALAEQYRFGPPYPAALLLPDAPTLHSRLLLAHGRTEEAAAELSAVGARLDARGWRNPVWSPWRSLLALAVAGDDPARARSLARDAVRDAERYGTGTAVGQALRMGAAVAESPDESEAMLELAVARLGCSPSAYEYALALVDHGAALRRVGRASDAAEQLRHGVQLANQCGAEALAARAAGELSAAGLRPRGLYMLGAEALTDRERRAAELAVRGVPSDRIAVELGTGVRIVDRLLAAVHRKLGTGREGLPSALGLPPEDPRDGG